MMTSMGGNRARGSWEQTQGQTQSQTQHKQRPQVPLTQLLSQSPACTTSSTGILCLSVNLVFIFDIFRLLWSGHCRADPTCADDFRPQRCRLWREGQAGEQRCVWVTYHCWKCVKRRMGSFIRKEVQLLDFGPQSVLFVKRFKISEDTSPAANTCFLYHCMLSYLFTTKR